MSGPELIRVMIVDDHEMVRRGLALSLQVFDDFELVGQAADGVEALQLVPVCRPDVILMDLLMPQMDGLSATKVVRRETPQIKVIALISFKEERLVEAARQVGADEVLLKNISIDELAAAIRTVMKAGNSPINPNGFPTAS